MISLLSHLCITTQMYPYGSMNWLAASNTYHIDQIRKQTEHQRLYHHAISSQTYSTKRSQPQSQTSYVPPEPTSAQCKTCYITIPYVKYGHSYCKPCYRIARDLHDQAVADYNAKRYARWVCRFPDNIPVCIYCTKPLSINIDHYDTEIPVSCMACKLIQSNYWLERHRIISSSCWGEWALLWNTPKSPQLGKPIISLYGRFSSNGCNIIDPMMKRTPPQFE